MFRCLLAAASAFWASLRWKASTYSVWSRSSVQHIPRLWHLPRSTYSVWSRSSINDVIHAAFVCGIFLAVHTKLLYSLHLFANMYTSLCARASAWSCLAFAVPFLLGFHSLLKNTFNQVAIIPFLIGVEAAYVLSFLNLGCASNRPFKWSAACCAMKYFRSSGSSLEVIILYSFADRVLPGGC